MNKMPGDALKWNKRASLLYAVGVWTIFGSFVFYRYRHGTNRMAEMPKEEEDTRPNVKKVKTLNMSATIVYKEDFVPYSTRLLNLFRPTSYSSSESQADEK